MNFFNKELFKSSGKQSYSLVSLGLYIIATGFLSVVVLNGKTVLENTKITRLIDEISFYNSVNK